MNELQVNTHPNEEKQGFTIQSRASANYALKKIREAEKKISENNEFAQEEIDRVEQWLKSENDEHTNTINFFQSHLAEYALNKREEDPKFKSEKLPNGSYGFRKSQPKWDYDIDKVVEYLEKSNLSDFLNIKKTPKKANIKKVFSVHDGKVINPDTGELVDGITVNDQEDKFNVKVAD